MDIEKLKEKALSLPLVPGVYLMRDKNDKVIYVGKAKKLKNRVAQYFQDTASHSPKTRLMVSHVDHFEVIVAASEFEALVLECSLIKRHMPKYNILLKDDKGYPYIRIDRKAAYPRITLSNRIENDGASYYGPFGSRGITNGIIDTVNSLLKLPSCSKKFPRDIGKDRPCLQFHMGQCEGWCQKGREREAYLLCIAQAHDILSGNYKVVADSVKEKMHAAADSLDFELAAALRNKLTTVESLGKKQLVTSVSRADTDVIGYAQTGAKACFAVLHFGGGNLLDKDYEVFSVPEDPEAAVSSLMKQYYLSRGSAPKCILLPFRIEDSGLFSELLQQRFGKKVNLHVPQRGDNVRLVSLANQNALQEAERISTKEEKMNGTLVQLGRILSISAPKRIESFDISNISGTDIVASMIVFENGKPARSHYKKFKIENLEGQDDYAAMSQVVLRRYTHLVAGDKGFECPPDLVLIDGGQAHAQAALSSLERLGLELNVLGMVKDDRHRTRALVTPDGKEIRIDNDPSIFSLIGNIQEETHRFAIGFHRQLRSKRLKYSELDNISGIGPKRKQDLLKYFHSVKAISSATLPELERCLPSAAAQAVFDHFVSKRREKLK